jgi:hypothetical protein
LVVLVRAAEFYYSGQHLSARSDIGEWNTHRESDNGTIAVDFDRRLKLAFHGARITSNAGLLAYRELDAALGLTDLAGAMLAEYRRGRNTRYLLAGPVMRCAPSL